MENITNNASLMLQKFPASTLPCLYVSIPFQKLVLINNQKITHTYPISTSKNPPSCTNNSYGTPWGLHHIKEKFGANSPKNMTFLGRKETGKLSHQWLPGEYPRDRENMITSRIMWLQGLEENVNSGPNCDSLQRYIYIHSSDQEHLVGKKPFSKGCILLTNDDIIQLFDLVNEGSLVYIDKH